MATMSYARAMARHAEGELDGIAVVFDEALRAHLGEQRVHYKIPRSFEYVDEPMRDDAGMPRRSALREARPPR